MEVKTMKQLLPHQIEDAQFLASKAFAGCFSGMGSGKTLTALEALRLALKSPTSGTKTAIIVGPPISLHMWKSEFEWFFPGKTAQLVKSGKTEIDANADAWIMSWAIARSRKDEFKGAKACALILDEAHAVKSPTAKTTKAMIGRGGLCEAVKHTWLLTGTPVTRWNDDLYVFLARADNAGMQTRLGGVTLDKFRLRYCVTQMKKFSPRQPRPVPVTVGNRNTDELNAWLFDGGLAVRRELKDVWAAMPPLTTNGLIVPMAMTPELREAMKEVADKTQREIEEGIARGETHIATLRRMIGMSKVPAAASEIADRVDSGAGAILVGAWHTEVIDALVDSLSGGKLRVGKLDGRTSASSKAFLQSEFNAGQLNVLVGQIAAMGVSLNLQHGGNRIIVVEEDWSPAVMDQFFARLHRMGQTEHVHVDILRGDNKLEEAVARIAGNKRREHGRVMQQEAVA
jgi:SNF2 family DNA or RNA helicase